MAFGATLQVLKAYASEIEKIFVEEEEYKISRLIDLRRDLEARSENAFTSDFEIQDEFPEIKNEEDLKEGLARHMLRYLQGIGAEDALIRVIKQPEFQSIRERGEPGI